MPKYEIKLQVKDLKKKKFVNKVVIVYAAGADDAEEEAKVTYKTKKIISCERLE